MKRSALRPSSRFLTALAACVVALVPAVRASNAAPGITYVSVDHVGALTTTAVNGINDCGEFVGTYDDAQGNFHGFAGQKGTSLFTPIDFPGAVQTYVFRINNWDEIVGTYFDHQGYQHGFVRFPSLLPGLPAFYIPFDVPGAAKTQGFDYELGTGLGTSAFGLNDLGEVTGQYADKNGVGHGFVLSYNGFTRYTAPGSSNVPGFYGGSGIADINDNGDVAGIYGDSSGGVHGFLQTPQKFTTIDPPGSIGTELFGINSSREASGFFYDAKFIGHGYIFSKGKYQIIDVPGAVYISTVGTVNNSGEFVGEYLDGLGLTHGYIATRH